MNLPQFIEGFSHTRHLLEKGRKKKKLKYLFVVGFLYLKLLLLDTRYTTMSRVYNSKYCRLMIENPFLSVYSFSCRSRFFSGCFMGKKVPSKPFAQHFPPLSTLLFPFILPPTLVTLHIFFLSQSPYFLRFAVCIPSIIIFSFNPKKSDTHTQSCQGKLRY